MRLLLALAILAALLALAVAVIYGLSALVSWAFGRMGKPQSKPDRRTN